MVTWIFIDLAKIFDTVCGIPVSKGIHNNMRYDIVTTRFIPEWYIIYCNRKYILTQPCSKYSNRFSSNWTIYNRFSSNWTLYLTVTTTFFILKFSYPRQILTQHVKITLSPIFLLTDIWNYSSSTIILKCFAHCYRYQHQYISSDTSHRDVGYLMSNTKYW